MVEFEDVLVGDVVPGDARSCGDNRVSSLRLQIVFSRALLQDHQLSLLELLRQGAKLFKEALVPFRYT